MTFDDDMIVLCFDGGTKRMSCKQAGLSWPPPEAIEIGGFKMHMARRSQISDEDRSTMTHVIRGAEYFPVKNKGE